MVSIEFDKETEKDVFRLVTTSKEVSLKIVVTLEAMEVVFFFYVNIMMMKKRPLRKLWSWGIDRDSFFFTGELSFDTLETINLIILRINSIILSY